MGGVHRGGDPDGLGGLFEDLEQQAEALELAEREAEVADRAHTEYRAVGLVERLQASVGARVRLEVTGPGTVAGRLTRVGADCAFVTEESDALRARSWVVALAHVTEVAGAVAGAVAPDAWPVTARLGWAAALRRIAEDQQPCVLVRTDARVVATRFTRVGADFVEHLPDTSPDRTTLLTPLAAIAAVRSVG